MIAEAGESSPVRQEAARRYLDDFVETLGGANASALEKALAERCALAFYDLDYWNLHHHERVDGTGYPDGLRGEAIPIGARILLVADALDAMTSDRTYRRALPMDEAARRLQAGAGNQFDARVVQAALRCLEKGTITLGPSALRAAR